MPFATLVCAVDLTIKSSAYKIIITADSGNISLNTCEIFVELL